MEKYRSKNFNLVLYDEDETHIRALEYIQKNYDYAMILHDKDFDEKTGEIKKPHYHIVIRFKNAKWNTALADELNITPNYIEESRNLKRSLQYLIHYNDENKHSYDMEEVQGTLTKLLIETINTENKTESEKVIELLNYIDNSDEFIDVDQFLRYCADIGYWDVYRRSATTFINKINRHNTNYS